METPFFEGWGAKPTKHGLCRGHLKLACGCRICARPGLNSNTKGQIPEAHVAQLERFHAKMHRAEARRQKAEHRRPAGDGLVEFDGRRIRPSQIAMAQYAKDFAAYKAKLAERQAAKLLRAWVEVEAPRSRAFEHNGPKPGTYHWLRFDSATQTWINLSGSRANNYEERLEKCAICTALIAKTRRFEAALAKRQGTAQVSAAPTWYVAIPDEPRAPVKPKRQKVEPALPPRSKLHRHSRKCREPIPTHSQWSSAPMGSAAYSHAHGLTIGYVIDGQTVETPAHYVMGIESIGDQRKGHYGTFWFPPAPLRVAFERCKLNGAPIPAKRVPAIISRTYKRWLGRQVKERKAEAEKRAVA